MCLFKTGEVAGRLVNTNQPNVISSTNKSPNFNLRMALDCFVLNKIEIYSRSRYTSLKNDSLIPNPEKPVIKTVSS